MTDYRTPGVYIEEVSGGPKPVQASSSTETGFVGVLHLPNSFFASSSSARLLLPDATPNPALSWSRALAFAALPDGKAPAAASGSAAPASGAAATAGAPAAGPAAAPAASSNRLSQLVQDSLGKSWTVQPPRSEDDGVLLQSTDGRTMTLPLRRSMLSLQDGSCDIAFGVQPLEVLGQIAATARAHRVAHSGQIPAANTKKSFALDLGVLRQLWSHRAATFTSIEGLEAWQQDVAATLFRALYAATRPSEELSDADIESVWTGLGSRDQRAWTAWVRALPGMQYLELAARGFFQNGGRISHVACGLQVGETLLLTPDRVLGGAFDGISSLAQVVAPGLNRSWQDAVLAYCGPRRRGDLFAVLDTPRYLLTRAPAWIGRSLDENTRWSNNSSPYEMENIQYLSTPSSTEIRYEGYADDNLLSRCIPRDERGHGAAYGPWLILENPLSTSAEDRYVVAPPSGHVAGMIAATDLKPGAGVHKAPANEVLLGISDLVTPISDPEQGTLNVRGINILRQRPNAGIRAWGARTVASDPLWIYINVRRLFLMVERSIRDAVQWAVFLPNNQATRNDLRSTIQAFLHRLYMAGMLDGKTWEEAYQVRCDSVNNPDADVRVGILTVDVAIRAVYPAEFVRIRFRQSPMKALVNENN